MPKDSSLRHVLPDANDPADIPTAVARTAFTGPMGILDVSSRAQANAISAAYSDEAFAAGVDAGRLYVWRTDTNQLEREGPNGWEYVAGRQHGATVTLSRSGVAAGGSPASLEVQSFVRASPGWTISGDSYVVVPQTGLYVMYASFSIDGAASSLGRVFFQFTTASGAFGARNPATNEDNIGGTAMWPLSAGDRLRMVGFHAAGGTRSYTATMQIAMLNAPSW